jgi:ATF/CREB family transcription factor
MYRANHPILFVPGIDLQPNSPNSGKNARGQKKPETEEEKRKNFLERNRQGESQVLSCGNGCRARHRAHGFGDRNRNSDMLTSGLSVAALKCRQRKKAWLAQLQAKVEFLTNENERLTSALVRARFSAAIRRV